MTNQVEEKPARMMVVMSQEYKVKIEEIATQHHVTQTIVLEALIDQMDVETIGALCEKKRQAKLAERAGKSTVRKQLLEKVRNLSPEKLEALLATVK